jgi:hypothetical protein
VIEENSSPKNEQNADKAPEPVTPVAPMPTPIPPPEPVITPDRDGSQTTTQTSQNQPEGPEQIFENTMSAFERRMITLTWIGIAVTAITGGILYSQFRVMTDQTKILSDQSISAVVGAIESERNTREQIKVAQDQANAAQDGVKAIQQQMRQDLRAWVNMETANFRWVENQPLLVIGTLINKGKTPAKHVFGQVVVEKISKGQIPNFIYKGQPRAEPDSGILVPNFPAQLGYQSLRFKTKGRDVPSNMEPLLMSKTDVADIREGRAYVAIHGIISYYDIFGIPRWTKFCTYNSGNPQLVQDFIKPCTDHNDTDNN